MKEKDEEKAKKEKKNPETPAEKRKKNIKACVCIEAIYTHV